MKSTILRWSGVTSAAVSSVWVVLLAALVIRCKWSVQPFPVLAKLSPFHNHLMLTDRWLTLFPAFASMAALLIGAACYCERSIRSVGVITAVSALLVLLSLVVVVLNPGGYFSWFLS
jgi:hypothetical protein